jgi:hypothetical protein
MVASARNAALPALASPQCGEFRLRGEVDHAKHNSGGSGDCSVRRKGTASASPQIRAPSHRAPEPPKPAAAGKPSRRHEVDRLKSGQKRP